MKNIFYLIFTLILISCHSNTVYKKPAHLISEDKMVDLLTDMQLAVAAKGIKNKHQQQRIDYMHLVYQKYGVDSLQFQENNLYYISRIDDYEKILNKVHAKLRNLKNGFEKENKIKDSILKTKKKHLKDGKKIIKAQNNFSKENLFLYSEPTFKSGPERNIKYESFDWSPLQFKNCTYFFYSDEKRPFRYGASVEPNKGYTISAYIKMDDLSKPKIGKSSGKSDFWFVIAGKIAKNNISIKHINNNIYRCSASVKNGGKRLTHSGIATYPKQSHKNFRVVGWQLEEGNKVGPYLPSK